MKILESGRIVPSARGFMSHSLHVPLHDARDDPARALRELLERHRGARRVVFDITGARTTSGRTRLGLAPAREPHPRERRLTVSRWLVERRRRTRQNETRIERVRQVDGCYPEVRRRRNPGYL